MTTGIACVAVAWLAAGAAPAGAKEKPTTEVQFGSLSGGLLYAADMGPDPVLGGAWVAVWRAPFRPAPEAVQESKKCLFFNAFAQAPYRYHVRDGLFWDTVEYVRVGSGPTVMRVPVEDLPLLDKDNKTEEFNKRHPKQPQWYAAPLVDWALDIKVRRTEGAGIVGGIGSEMLVADFYYDVLPVGKTEALVFALNDKHLRVWRGVATKAKADDKFEWDVKWEELKDRRAEVDVDEPFTAVRQGDMDFLVTRSGKLYVLKKGDKDKWKAEAVWKDADSPIRAVVRDEDAGRAFAFTEPAPEAKDGREVYFELSDKPDPAAYEPRPLKGANLDEPLATLMGLAYFLYDQKKIK